MAYIMVDVEADGPIPGDYAFMQAVGMVNDHLADCFRHAELK